MRCGVVLKTKGVAEARLESGRDTMGTLATSREKNNTHTHTHTHTPSGGSMRVA